MSRSHPHAELAMLARLAVFPWKPARDAAAPPSTRMAIDIRGHLASIASRRTQEQEKKNENA
jgi:hypothetical protein